MRTTSLMASGSTSGAMESSMRESGWKATNMGLVCGEAWMETHTLDSGGKAMLKVTEYIHG